MKLHKYKNIDEFGEALGIPKERIAISKMKTQLKKRIIQEAEDKNLSAAEIAATSGLARTVVSGILNKSLQSVSFERLLKLAVALDLKIELKIKPAA